jgi:hypothetical protein
VKKRLAGAGVVLALTLAACGGGSSTSGSADTVPEVVSGSSWVGVRVMGGTGSADVPPDARKKLTPLLATRVFSRPAPLSEYGLDHPQAALTFTAGSGATADVDIGQPNFDRHFLYVQRRGRPSVYLVAADALRPVLALVGIEIAPPA